MVKTDRRGLRDWVIQRVTAIIIGAYALMTVIYLYNRHPLSYSTWNAFFHYPVVKIFTIVTLFSILWHAWIGLWTVYTDYIKSKIIRVFIEAITLALLLFYLVWAVKILWI